MTVERITSILSAIVAVIAVIVTLKSNIENDAIVIDRLQRDVAVLKREVKEASNNQKAAGQQGPKGERGPVGPQGPQGESISVPELRKLINEEVSKKLASFPQSGYAHNPSDIDIKSPNGEPHTLENVKSDAPANLQDDKFEIKGKWATIFKRSDGEHMRIEMEIFKTSPSKKSANMLFYPPSRCYMDLIFSFKEKNLFYFHGIDGNGGRQYGDTGFGECPNEPDYTYIVSLKPPEILITEKHGSSDETVLGLFSRIQ